MVSVWDSNLQYSVGLTQGRIKAKWGPKPASDVGPLLRGQTNIKDETQILNFKFILFCIYNNISHFNIVDEKSAKF